jgi:hypothetical protein
MVSVEFTSSKLTANTLHPEASTKKHLYISLAGLPTATVVRRKEPYYYSFSRLIGNCIKKAAKIVEFAPSYVDHE